MTVGGAKRVVNDFKASLNLAGKRYRSQLPADFRDSVRDGLASVSAASPVAREKAILPAADIRRIVAAAWEIDREGDWGGDLAPLVVVMAACGMRYSQAVRMTVADVQVAQKRLMIPVSGKGRGEKRITRIAFPVGDDILAALATATAGRVGTAHLFLRPRFEKLAVARYVRAERGPWHTSADLAGPWKEIVKRAGLAKVTPYALRHSSVVRMLLANVPTRMVAALHDTSVLMLEKFYSAYILDAADDLARKALVPLVEQDKVVRLVRA
jgi:integrase